MDKKRRIDIVIPTLEVGGAERAASLLYRNLKKNYSNIRLVTTNIPKGDLLEDDFITISEGFFPGVLGKILSVRKTITENRTDIVIVFLNHTSILVFIALLFVNIKVVACERSNPFNSGRTFIHQFISKIVYKSIAAVVVQTDRLKLRMEKEWALENLTVIPNSAPVINDSPRNVRVIADQYITVCRLVESKNCETLISTMKNILLEGAQLKIFGEGPEKVKLKQLITKLGLDKHISIISGCSDVSRMLFEADVFISLSSLEGFPNSLLEAVSSGVPSMAYDCDFGPSEILAGGSAGQLLSSLDSTYIEEAIRAFSSNYQRRLKFSKNGLSHSYHSYSSQKVLSKWLLMIEQL